jgi:hypothetical protein
MSSKTIIGVFDDESILLKTLRKLKSNGVNIKDIYGPCADHDLLKEFTRESRLPYVSVLTGLFTILATFAFIYYVSVIDYPLHYGGKPVFSFPPMVVILFLVCILVTGGVSTFAFLGREQMFPGKDSKLIDPRAANDRFFLVLDQNFNPEEIKEWLKESGADEIIEKDIDE